MVGTKIYRQRVRLGLLAGGLIFAAWQGSGHTLSAFAQTAQTRASPAEAKATVKPFDARLLRLSEILGAVHHLREICSANEGQLWRDQMTAIMKAEQPPALLRGRMVVAFNSSYRSYQRTYGTCTPSAKTATTRFFSEGMAITRGLAEEFRGKHATKKAKSPPDTQSQSQR